MNYKARRAIKYVAAALGAAFAVSETLAVIKKPGSVFDDDPAQKNPFEGKKVIFIKDDNDPENADGERGHLEAVGNAEGSGSFYQRYVKRGIDVVLSFGGLVALSPVIAGLSIAIKIDDPGPVLFTQKRVGQNKRYFKLHKFRSMKMATPHDVPTHMLENPDQYITRVGKFIRAHSLDELPQIWDIFIGNMSVIGPRPALWNQDVLTALRDEYGVNEIKPGLTGWAQINGRDELELPDKARFDGEYADELKKGGLTALAMDCKCFTGTIHSVANSEGVVEGGTGEMKKQDARREGVPAEDPETALGCDLELKVDTESQKKVLITGAGSYIGESVKAYAEEHYPNLIVDTVDMLDGTWRDRDFSGYDCVYHVAGIAHADVGNVSDEIKEKYYAVNTDLALEVANKAKAEGVKQFIFMSSMIVYGDSAPFGREKMVDRHTKPQPANFYGDSKWQADKGVRALADGKFKVAVLRPPMIYGRGSKGNYPVLAKMAKKLPVFPDIDNQRSMLYIENLCEFVCDLIMTGEGGIYFPQNAEFTRTSDMVKQISKAAGKPVAVTKLLAPAVSIASHAPGKISGLVNKAFGNSCYDQELSRYTFNYVNDSLSESILKTESDREYNGEIRKVCIINCFDTYEHRVDLLHDYFEKNGFDVSVYTSDYRHFEKTVREDSKKDFRLFHAIPYAKNMSATRMLSHYRLAKDIFKAADKESFDLLWVLVPPNSFASQATRFKARHPECRLIVDIIDLWPETMPLDRFKNTPPFALWKNMRDNCLRTCDAVVTECDLYKEYLPYEVLDKTRTLYLAREKAESAPLTGDLPDDRLSLCYLGSINNIIDIDVIKDLVAGIKAHRPIELHVIGDGERREELLDACREAGAEVIYHGRVYDKAEKAEILSRCHYGLNIMKDSVIVGLTMKSMDYFEAGLPLINNIKGDTWELVDSCKTGHNLDGSYRIYEEICDYQTDMRKHTRELFERYFCRDSFEDGVKDIIRGLK